MTRHLAGLLFAALLALLLTAVPTTGGQAAAATSRLHFIANLHGSTAPARLGFNLFDTGDGREQINHLPAGVRAMVWLGQKCPTRANRAFRRTVRRLARNPRVYGYLLSDEPHVADCPRGPAALATRARFIRRATGNRQKSFIVLSKPRDYRAFRPRVSRVNLVGLDPYPCSVAHPGCDLSKIGQHVRAALRRGIPRGRLIPVYQAFGQEKTSETYYTQPTPDQLQRILDRWAALLPNPRFDYTYGWGNQRSADPTLVDAPGLQQVLATYFAS